MNVVSWKNSYGFCAYTSPTEETNLVFPSPQVSDGVKGLMNKINYCLLKYKRN